jgi:hypothetical protein
MDKQDILELLEAVRVGRASVAQGVERLRHLPYEDLGFAKIDHHRGLRQGFAEVIYAKGKTPAQVVAILRGMLRPRATNNILITRGDPKLFRAVRRLRRDAKFHALSGAITIRRNRKVNGQGTILILAAGTSDIPVAEEAAVTARADRRGASDRVRGRDGGRAAERRRGTGRGASHCRTHQRGIWRQLWRVDGASGDAEQLRVKRVRRQHRQRFWRRLRRERDEPALKVIFGRLWVEPIGQRPGVVADSEQG